MRTFSVEPQFNDTVDMLALAIGYLSEPTPNNSIGQAATDAEAEALIKEAEKGGQVAQYVIFNPQDYHLFRYRNPRLIHHFDYETQQRLVRRGIVGYLWGTTVVLDKNVTRGYIVVSADSRENALKSDKSLIVEISKLEIPNLSITVSKASTDWSNGPCPVSQDQD